MRLVFFYVMDGASKGLKWDPSIPATNFFANRIKDEGYFYILKRMVEEKIVDEVLIIVESSKGTGFTKYGEKITGYTMPDIADFVKDYLLPEDIIYIRGGFKGWYVHLEEMQRRNHWLLIYAANTGREKWPFWSVVFNDLAGTNRFDHLERFQFDFKKPINPNLFFPIKLNRDYDVCIGASHIHDKKGQWRTVQALIEYKRIFGENLKCIMPGAFRRGTETNKMIKILQTKSLDVELPSMISRSKLNRIYNRSKLFVHLGGGGQGDRGPLEALRCGCPVMVGNNFRHSRTVYSNKRVSTVLPINATPEDIARNLYFSVASHSERLRKEAHDHFETVNGIETIILPDMKRLFDIFRDCPKYDASKLIKLDKD